MDRCKRSGASPPVPVDGFLNQFLNVVPDGLRRAALIHLVTGSGIGRESKRHKLLASDQLQRDSYEWMDALDWLLLVRRLRKFFDLPLLC